MVVVVLVQKVVVVEIALVVVTEVVVARTVVGTVVMIVFSTFAAVCNGPVAAPLNTEISAFHLSSSMGVPPTCCQKHRAIGRSLLRVLGHSRVSVHMNVSVGTRQRRIQCTSPVSLSLLFPRHITAGFGALKFLKSGNRQTADALLYSVPLPPSASLWAS